MTSSDLLRTCFVSACANALFNKRDSNPLDLHKAAVVARRTTRLSAALSLTHRLHRLSLTTTARPGRRRRTPWSDYHPQILRWRSRSLSPSKLTTNRFEVIRRSARTSALMDEMVLLQRSIDESMRNGTSTLEERRHPGPVGNRDDTKPRQFSDEPLASPSSNIDEVVETRSTRSASTASRSTNRLSLTLPIVPATAYPSRPAPASSTTHSFPPTPLDTSSLMSPADSADFITAIAAQERRVLELREELSRTESDLARLKKQWATHEAYKKRGVRRNIEPIPGLGMSADPHDETAIRRSVELDRRKALLGQQNQQVTPERARRRVFTGSHTRTLSLLSPTKLTGGFSANEDEPESAKADFDNRSAAAAPALQPKRASWASRSTQSTGVKQLAEDLKTGLWTFMEDLRQATVGDEPITGQGVYMRGINGSMRPAASGNSLTDQDTIRPPNNPRLRLASAFEETPEASNQDKVAQLHKGGAANSSNNGDEDDGAPRPSLQRSKTDSGPTRKRFSWAPLPVEALDDNDWSNWDSPNISSPRWSGTTVNGDIIPSIPEKRAADGDEDTLLLTTRYPSPPPASSAAMLSGLSPNKLEDMLPQALNRLTPSKLKKTAADFMKEWERSLSSPVEIPVSVAAVGKEKGV
ncbi:hypothetical protein N657DRAFT_657103 [Parathielavia appendiculata]|uniref:DUF4048 domain-containing protein n=1 Tax=Parathielavia appendiculata TaxID=2587402 RepID=A0AAN6Z1U1_9PEZI|nr:hypothetical protein N657DRAFT_657103 [Parathielavia appendiculata]